MFPNLLQKRNMIAIAPTGSGKTYAYIIPLISNFLKDNSQKILIIAPTFDISV